MKKIVWLFIVLPGKNKRLEWEIGVAIECLNELKRINNIATIKK